MATIATRAITRALNYALESVEGHTEKTMAIRADYKRLLAEDFSEVAIVATLSRVAVRTAQMARLNALGNANDLESAEAAIDYGLRLKAAIMRQEIGPLD